MPVLPSSSRFEDRLDDALELVGVDLARLGQRLDHFANGSFFVHARSIGADRVTTNKVGKLHAH